MKSVLFRLYLQLMRLLGHFVAIKDKQVVILNGAGRSGSNGYLFYKYLQEKHPEYQVTLVEPWPSSHLPWSSWKKIAAAKYVVTTHQPFKIHASQVNVQLWHGFPLKRMGIMASNTRHKDNQRNAKLWHKNADLIASSSDLYETLMSSCVSIEAQKYQKTGFPRLDYLKTSPITRKQLLQDLFGLADDQAKIGIYMPTFRYELEDDNIMKEIGQGNFFASDDFEIEALNEALKKRHQYLIVKLHPYEMKLFSASEIEYSNLAFLNNDYLFKNDHDLYELLANTDFLMTDFSSIYFDYLELDRPIIFMANHLQEYDKTRGLLFGPYKQVVPGPVVYSQADFVKQLDELDKPMYQERRHYWHDLTNQVQNKNYCNLLFEAMTKLTR